MNREAIAHALRHELFICCQVYNRPMGKEEVESLARNFADALYPELRAERTIELARMAFAEHVREGEFFPRPVDILSRIPFCRGNLRRKKLKFPSWARDQGGRTPHYGSLFAAAMRGNVEALEYLAPSCSTARRQLAALQAGEFKPRPLGEDLAARLRLAFAALGVEDARGAGNEAEVWLEDGGRG